MAIEPVDVDRCQGESRPGAFALGPNTFRRCGRLPTAIVLEREDGEDGHKGSMSLCEHCLPIMQDMTNVPVDVIHIKERGVSEVLKKEKNSG